MRRAILSMLMVLGLRITSTRAIEVYEDLHVHGFLSQGYFLTSDNNIFGNSDGSGSLDFTEIGVNASWELRPNLRLAVQGISRRAGEGSDGEPQLDFALLDYSPINTETQRFGARLGRVRLPLGLYNDTRDVAFARPAILLPQSIYFEQTRDPTLSADGVMTYGERHGPWGSLIVEFGPFFPRVDNLDTELALLGVDEAGSLSTQLSYIGRLTYELDGGWIRLMVTGTEVNVDYEPAVTDTLGPGSDRFTPVIFSAQFNGERLLLASEYAIRPIRHAGFGADLDFDITGESYYFQAAYRFLPGWEVMGRYDVLYNDVDDRDGTAFKALVGGSEPAHSQFARDWTVGLRYDITPSWMVRAEYHRIHGTAWVSDQDNSGDAVLEKKWDVFALLASYRF